MSLKKIKIQLYDGYFLVWDKTFSFNELQWINADIDKDWNIINFIIIPKATLYPLKYKVVNFANQDKIKKFISNIINQWVLIYSDYENEKMYKIIKFFKLW